MTKKANVKYFPPQQITPLKHVFDEYTRAYTNLGSDYSITDLIKPPRVVQLFKRHKDAIHKMGWDWYSLPKSFKGSAIHDRLEMYLYRYMGKHPEEEYLLERRLWDRICDRKISGKFDMFRQKGNVLYDWKTCSVWKRVREQYEDFEIQLNMYAYMLRKVGIDVQALMIVAWYQDWDKNKSYEKGYPKSEIEGIQMKNLWSTDEQEKYLHAMIERHKAAEDLPDNELPHCSAKDRWDRESVWKVMHPDAKKSLRNLPTEEEALQWIKDYDKRKSQKYDTGRMKPEFIPGERVRCSEFCKANVFCNQWQEHLNIKVSS
jgi:hypothetical protein